MSRLLKRTLATTTGILDRQPSVYKIFDRNAKRMQKDRAASRDGGLRSRTVDYVRDEVASRMSERILDIKRRFSHIVDIGSGPGHLSKLIDVSTAPKITMFDLSEKTLFRDSNTEFEAEVEREQLDEESFLNKIPHCSVPAITSCLSLHWTNDLPGVLRQLHDVLEPDGLFIAAMFGGETLFELRTSLQLAELEREGGLGIRVSPMTDTRDISGLLTRAGFTLTTVDIEDLTVTYPSMFELIEDLRDMGESNAVLERRPFMRRDTLCAASAIYREMHGLPDDSIPATFQIVHMIGWRPSPGQAKPLNRGSAQASLKDVL